MNAKELAVKVRRVKDSHFSSVTRNLLNQLADDIAADVEQLVPRYRPPQPSDDGRWCFLEELPSDAPPTLVRIEPYIHDYPPHVWQFWTVAGWRELTKGVWPCERPEGGGT